MNIDGKENTLYLVDKDVEIVDLLTQKQTIQLENFIVLSIDRILPFDDLMRSIIIAIYRYNIKKIVVVSSSQNNNKQKSLCLCPSEEFKEGYQEKVQTLNYLFKNCKPEFPGDDINEWLGNGGTRNTVSVIRQHPLIPSDIKITEINDFNMGLS